MRFNSIKKVPGFERAHIENMHGTPADSRKYCTKVCDWKNCLLFEKGNVPPTIVVD